MNAKNIQRKNRGQTELIYLRKVKIISELSREYDILGSSSMKYTVWICNSPICTCPDFHTRKARCKHIYYVLQQILNAKDELVDKNDYSDSDLRSLFNYETNNINQEVSTTPSNPITTENTLDFITTPIKSIYEKLFSCIPNINLYDQDNQDNQNIKND